MRGSRWTSGAQHLKHPTRSKKGPNTWLAQPKSDNFKWPDELSKRFSTFKSRCTTPFWCMWAKPLKRSASWFLTGPFTGPFTGWSNSSAKAPGTSCNSSTTNLLWHNRNEGCLKGIPPSTYLRIIKYYSGIPWVQKNIYSKNSLTYMEIWNNFHQNDTGIV